jgi:hypothetical protein
MEPEGAVGKRVSRVIEQLRLSLCGHSVIHGTAAASLEVVFRKSRPTQKRGGDNAAISQRRNNLLCRKPGHCWKH